MWRLRTIIKYLGHLLGYAVDLVLGRTSHPVILAYHTVCDSSWPWAVAPAQFEKQMCFLKEKRNIVPLEEVVAYVRGEKELPRGSVAITIDDGYKDTVETVLPVLETYNLHATLFLTTDLADAAHFGGSSRPTWDGVRRMHESGHIDIQAHGHSHKRLTDLIDTPHALRGELATCNHQIQTQLGTTPKYLAYAFGAKSKELAPFVKEAGYEAAFSIHEGAAVPTDEPYFIRRVQIDRSMPLTLFRLRTGGAVERYRQIKSLFS